MFLPLLLLLIIPPSLSEKSTNKNKTECDFQLPVTVSFSSLDLNNTLIWKPPENVKGLRYTVQYKEYGKDIWQKKLECTNITVTWCDLTNETRSNGEYQGKVIIYTETCRKSKKTEKFHPLLQTNFSSPKVRVLSGDASITIKLTHPIQFLHEKFKGFVYNIYINDRLIETKDPYYVIEKIDPKTKYCITAKVYWYMKNSNMSEETCITTDSDHTTAQTIAWMIYILPVTLIFCIVITTGYGIHKYIHASNLKQPTILNLTTSRKKNVILVDAYNVTMNVITIECGKANFEDTMMFSKEEDKSFQNNNELHITDGGDHLSCGTEVIDIAEIEATYDDGYVSLQEQVTPVAVTTGRPTISPYDMPHQPLELVKPPSTSTDTVCEETDLYGNVERNVSLSPLQENDDLPDGYTTEKAIVNDFYLPQANLDFPNGSIINEDLHELENSSMGQETELVNVTEYTDFNESSTLFIDWTPDKPLYLPNLSKKKELENCIKNCQEERRALLCQLYLQNEEKGTLKDKELEQMKERWGLLVQDSET